MKPLLVTLVAACAVGGAGVAAGVPLGVGVATGVGAGVGEGFPCGLAVAVGVGVAVGVSVAVAVAVAVGVGDGKFAQSPGPAVLLTKPVIVPLNGEDTVPEGGSPPVVFTTTTKL